MLAQHWREKEFRKQDQASKICQFWETAQSRWADEQNSKQTSKQEDKQTRWQTNKQTSDKQTSKHVRCRSCFELALEEQVFNKALLALPSLKSFSSDIVPSTLFLNRSDPSARGSFWTFYLHFSAHSLPFRSELMSYDWGAERVVLSNEPLSDDRQLRVRSQSFGQRARTGEHLLKSIQIAEPSCACRILSGLTELCLRDP